MKTVKKRNKGKRFLPIFSPSYIKVIGVRADGILEVMQIAGNIEYAGNEMRIYIYLRKN